MKATAEAGAPNLADMVHRRATDDPERVALVTVEDASGASRSWTYGELDTELRRVAARLQQKYAPGGRALIMCEPGINYVLAFLGCAFAGLVAVPAYPPSPFVLERSLKRLRSVAADADAEVAITSSMLMPFTSDMAVTVGGEPIPWFQVDGSEAGAEEGWRPPQVAAGDLLFLQYTSGSTGDPRGVRLTHANLAAHLPMIREAFAMPERPVLASWLPPYHDMGLMSGILYPLAEGGTTVMMAPDLFLRRPHTWLRSISEHHVFFSAAPNFAFDLCVRRVSEEDCEGLDLSCWQRACNGAEPVRSSTLDRFVEKFGRFGFRRSTFYPSYGLAEVMVLASTATVDREGGILHARPGSVQAGRFEARVGGDSGQPLVSCGRPPAGSRILAVDPDRRTPLPEGEVGELWIGGPHVADGYWNRPEESEATFMAETAEGDGPFLRTGDLGFRRRGDVVVTGRIKDLIIVRGENHYPQDLERSVEQADPSLRPGCGAAFAVDTEPEGLVIVQEVGDSGPDKESLVEAIRRALITDHQVEPVAVVLVAARTIPKTSSGKIQRGATRASYLAGDLQVVHQWAVSPR